MTAIVRHRLLLAGGALAALWLLAQPALADETAGGYVGAGPGRYNIRIHNATDLGETIDDYSRSDTAYKIFAGWRFAPFVALEADYINLGNNREFFGSTGTQYQTKIYGWAPELVATLPLGNPASDAVVGPVELFADIGEYWYRYHRTIDTPVSSFASSSDDFHHVIYGGGVGLVFAQRIPVRLEYQEFNIANTNTSNALWLTGAFRF
jgi:hypothetical protein